MLLKHKKHAFERLPGEVISYGNSPFSRLALSMLCALGLALPARGHGDLDLQIATMGESITKEPNNPDLFLRRAELHRLHTDWAAAQRDIDRATELAPDLATVDLVLARLLLDTKRFEGAEEALDRFLARLPNHVDALVTRARARMGAGKHLLAAEDFGKAIERAPSPEPEYYIEQAHALAAAGSERIPDALSVLDRGMTKLGKLVTLGLYAVELECVRKNFDAALERLESLSARQPRQEAWHERRGDVLAAAGRTNDAKAAYQAGVDAIKVLPPHIQNTAAVQQRQERLQQKLKENVAFTGSAR